MGICFPNNGLRQPPTHPNKLRDQTHYQKLHYYVKWREYPLEESTWEPLSNLTNAQEVVQLFLNKKNWEGGILGEEGDDVRIDNSPPLEPQVQEQELNRNLDPPGPPGLWTAGLPAHIFLGSSPCKLTLKIMAHPVKQIKLRKLLHQVECQSRRLMEAPKQ
ncbi:M-phase phosphoprotein 8 [Entomophthora muscae]|uniref:M-phase phosphoprotein 8 n=1 Tax=Entomophthora muscae TaxID=34485 RepID=A0ACC2SLC3_9FUNG|nr:M-phase phosphoprotein 8 [Entomophthora muscae]